ncbi:hypothetical protein ES708_13066 [subsurface metagenome]
MPHIGYFPVREYPKPLSIGPPAFVPSQDDHDWIITRTYLNNRTSLDGHSLYSPVFLPQGATVTKLKLQGKRNVSGDMLLLNLERVSPDGPTDTMAALVADWTGGDGSIETTTITYPTIDNNAYSYVVYTRVDPKEYVLDVQFYRAEITWN